MSKKDMFANFATKSSGDRKELLKEIYPIEYKRIFFAKSNKVVDYNPLNHKEQLDTYYEGLEKLKVQYVPFLKRVSPQLKIKRNKLPINTFSYRFNKSPSSEEITIPHYHGPIGRWTSTYQTNVNTKSLDAKKRTYLVCKGIDYNAKIYINGNFVMAHEGFFATFDCDISQYIDETIELTIVVDNDIPTLGNNDIHVNGDKLYAATGLGWDDPQTGWHHCPAGGGIFDQVYLEQREKIFISDIFIKPNIDQMSATVTMTLYSHINENVKRNIAINITPYNFESMEQYELLDEVLIGYGHNYYTYNISMKNAKLWEMEQPHLYNCQGNVNDSHYEATFGMRKFYMDQAGELKGDLFFNNKPIILRGANEMGHLQLCVARNDYEQLIEDILIAKYCNMNYYRITQRPVQEEIYHYCDMLGMLNQVDFPLFGYVRKNQFYEGIKQAGEMERHVRNHPSVIMATYINEPFNPAKYELAHRHLSRVDLEHFFDSCDGAVLFENSDRVIKRVEGDYDPPTNKGLSDFHCYNMWYTNHALPVGMLYKGYLPALKSGWKTGCGEYGTEGLDNLKVMKKYYPKEWLPDDDSNPWIPDKIVKAQSNSMHGDWYEEQLNINDWIEQSQLHQAFATKLMTEAFRRRNDVLVSTAIHLLIDAWPSGWMKTLVDVDRVPKKAYFSFKEALLPLKGSLRSDRWQGYENELIEVEAWILNDTSNKYNNLTMYATINNQDGVFDSYVLDTISIDQVSSKLVGIIPVTIPPTTIKKELYVDIELRNEEKIINRDRLIINIYPKLHKKVAVYPIGRKAKELIYESQYIIQDDFYDGCTVLITDNEKFSQYEQSMKNCKKIFLKTEKGNTYIVDGKTYTINPIFPEEIGEDCDVKGLSFVACHKDWQQYFGNDNFSYLYNNDIGYIDHVATHYVKGPKLQEILYSYQKPSFGGKVKGQKKRLPVVAQFDHNFFITLELAGRIQYNPIIDKLLINIITEMETI